MLSDAELATFEELAAKFEVVQLDRVLGIVQNKLHPVFQRINDGGRTAANEANRVKLAELQSKHDAAAAKITALEGEVTELKAKTPEAKELIRQHEEKLAAAKTETARLLAEKDALIKTERFDRAMRDFDDALIEQGVDPDYARTVLVKKDEYRDRVRVSDDGKVSILQKGNQELTITPAEGKTAFQHLAEEVAATVEDKWKTTTVQRGPKMKGSIGGDATGKEHFDALRSAVPAMVGRNKGRGQAGEASARMHGTPRLKQQDD